MYRTYSIRAIHMYRMYGSRTTHMYRMYGIRAMQELLPRSSCRRTVHRSIQLIYLDYTESVSRCYYVSLQLN